MGHDEHFLRRLDRVSDHHVELSLTLYRDEELLREVLSRADLPPGAERLAISLNDPTEGPFVIVTRTGKFVTCLGEGMRVGNDLVVLTRPRLDAAISKVERMRERIAKVEMLEREGHDGTAQKLFAKLASDGLRFCREDAETLIEVWPLIGRDASANFTELVHGMNQYGDFIARLRFDKLRPTERQMVHHFGRIAWSASNLIVLTTELDSSEYFDDLDAARDVDARVILWRALFRFGSFSHCARVLWSIGQRRKRALEPLRDLHGVTDLEATLMREFGLGVVAIGTPKVRAEAIKALSRKLDGSLASGATPRDEALHELRGFAGQCGEVVRAMLAAEAECDAHYVAYGRRIAASLLCHVEGVEVTQDITDGIPEDVARAMMPNLPHSWAAGQGSHVMSMALPWLARAKPAELFLPRAFAERIPAANEDEVEVMMTAYAEARGLKQSTVRNEAPKVGRNDPCTCGSGKKYKRCCGAS